MTGKVYRGNFQELNRLCAIKDARIAELEAAVHDLIQQWDHEDGHAVPGPTKERLSEIRLLVGRT